MSETQHGALDRASAKSAARLSADTPKSPLKLPVQRIAGVTMLLTFVTSVGWILPINGPQNMLAYGTGTFAARDFIRVGIVLTAIAYAMLLVFAATYWRWLGYT